MVEGAAAQPPSSAPGCRSELELNRSQVQVSGPASFMGPRSKTQGEKWRQPRLYRTNVRESRPQSDRPYMSRAGPSRSDRPMGGNHLGFLSSHSVALVAGLIPVATMPL